MLKFSRGPALQKFSYVKALVQNHFNQERHFGTVRQNELELCREAAQPHLSYTV